MIVGPDGDVLAERTPPAWPVAEVPTEAAPPRLHAVWLYAEALRAISDRPHPTHRTRR